MITEKDLQEAIAECQGQKYPNASTCMKLAAYYTILNQMYPDKHEVTPQIQMYSNSSGVNPYEFDSGSEFSECIKSKNYQDVMTVMDELMDTLNMINSPLYNGVLRKLSGL